MPREAAADLRYIREHEGLPGFASGGIIGGSATVAGMTDAEYAQLRHDFGQLLARPYKVSLKDALPRRTRLRLWLTHQVDGAAIWLVERHHERMALSLWRVFRLWY